VHRDNPSDPTHRSSAAALAGRFLFLSRDPRDGDNPNWRRAGRWLSPWGLAIGALYAAVFGLFWRGFGEYQGIRWIPVAAVVAVDLAWGGYRLLAGAASLAAHDGTARLERTTEPNVQAAVTVVLIGIIKFALLASLPIGTWQTPPAGVWGWEAVFAKLGPLYPDPVYRPLILMPFWGRWAMSLATSIGRPSAASTPRFQWMAQGASLATILLQWLLGAVLTVVYCSGSGEHVARGVVIALSMLLVAYVASFTLARQANGQTEATISATGVAVEVVFLALYVGVSSAIYWY